MSARGESIVAFVAFVGGCALYAHPSADDGLRPTETDTAVREMACQYIAEHIVVGYGDPAEFICTVRN